MEGNLSAIPQRGSGRIGSGDIGETRTAYHVAVAYRGHRAAHRWQSVLFVLDTVPDPDSRFEVRGVRNRCKTSDARSAYTTAHHMEDGIELNELSGLYSERSA